MSAATVARLGEAHFDRLAEAAWRAIAVVDPGARLRRLPRPAVLGRRADPALPRGRQGGRPARQRDGEATREASPGTGKSISTRLIAEVVANTGWTWDEALDGLTTPRFSRWRGMARAVRPRTGWSPPRCATARPTAPSNKRRRADRRRSCAPHSRAAGCEHAKTEPDGRRECRRHFLPPRPDDFDAGVGRGARRAGEPRARRSPSSTSKYAAARSARPSIPGGCSPITTRCDVGGDRALARRRQAEPRRRSRPPMPTPPRLAARRAGGDIRPDQGDRRRDAKDRLALYADETRQHDDHHPAGTGGVETGARTKQLRRRRSIALQQERRARRGTRWRRTTRSTNQISQPSERTARDSSPADPQGASHEQAQQYQALRRNGRRSAFNSQLRGLLSGTENWRTAFKNVLERPADQLHRMGRNDRGAQVATEAAQDRRDDRGREPRARAPNNRARGFAGDAGGDDDALDPVLGGGGLRRRVRLSFADHGPFAAGPAAAAQATVAGMAGAVASADIGMWQRSRRTC